MPPIKERHRTYRWQRMAGMESSRLIMQSVKKEWNGNNITELRVHFYGRREKKRIEQAGSGTAKEIREAIIKQGELAPLTTDKRAAWRNWIDQHYHAKIHEHAPYLPLLQTGECFY